MDLVDFFILAIFAIMGLSLLSYIIGAIRNSSPFWKITWLIVLMVLVTGAVVLM